jgi:hypothetical protein
MTSVFSLVLLVFAAGSARFEPADGTVRDTTTSLVWSQKDDWRLPKVEELQGLYDEKVAAPPTYLYHGKPYPLRMDPAFQLSAPGIWSSSMRYENRGVAWSFFFSSGRQLATAPTATNYQRALCVRGG